jgi:hypothetical protein
MFEHKNKNDSEASTAYQAVQKNLQQDVKEIFSDYFPNNPVSAFGEEFFKEHGAQGGAKHAEKFQAMSKKLTNKMKAHTQTLKKEFDQASRENSVFIEARVRPLLSKPHIKATCKRGEENILSFVRRAHFVFLHATVKNTIVKILDWATGEFKGGATERVVHYVLLGFDILLNDNKFKTLSPRVQCVALSMQFKDLYLFQARRILFKVWERHFELLSEEAQIAELKEAVCTAAEEKAKYKAMDISSEYIIDMVRECEYLSERGEDVVRHVYDLLSSNLSLWHKYHLAKAISSPALARLQASDAHYAQLLDAMKHSIDIAIASAKVGERSVSSPEEYMASEPAGLFLNDGHDDEVFLQDDDDLVDEYVNSLILSPAPPDYICALNDMGRSLLVQIVKDLFLGGAKRETVDSLMNMLANPVFMNLSDRSKRRLLGLVRAIAADEGKQGAVGGCEQALYNVVYFVCHPQIVRLAHRDVEWLIESMERLKVNFYDNSEASAMIEFLESFHKVAEGTELTTMCFYLGRLSPAVGHDADEQWAEREGTTG